MDWPRLYVDSVDGQLVWLSVSVRMDWLVWRASWMKRVEKMVMCLFEVVFFPLKVVIFNWKNKWSITMVKPEARAVTPTEIAIWTDSLNEKLFENNFIQSLIGKKTELCKIVFLRRLFKTSWFHLFSIPNETEIHQFKRHTKKRISKNVKVKNKS